MAKKDSAIDFTFDTSGFEAAIKSMGDHFKGFKDEIINAMQDTSEKTKDSIFGGVFKANVYMEAIKKLLGFVTDLVKGFVPELLETVSVGADIMMKNLFWPLRKELLPMFQKILDWITANRKMFIQWGSVLVNIFRTIKQFYESLYQIIKPVTDYLINLFKKIFGDTSQSIVNTINLILFKIVSLIITLQLLLSPVVKKMVDDIDWLGGKIKLLIMGIINFGAEFIKLGGKVSWFMAKFDYKIIKGSIEVITEAFKFIAQIIEDITGEKFDKSLFRIENLGPKIALGFKNAFVSMFEGINQFFKMIGWILDLLEGKIDIKEAIAGIAKNTPQFVGELGERLVGVEPSPSSSLPTAAKTSGKENMSFYFGDITIAVPEGGNIKDAGRDFVESVEKNARKALMKNRLVSGEK